MSRARHDDVNDAKPVESQEIAGNLGSEAGARGTPRKHGGRVEKEEEEKKTRRHEKKAFGGKVVEGKEAKMHGAKAPMRMDRAPRRASGGRVGSDCSPLSSAGRGDAKEMLRHGGAVKKKH